jgi:hypothetical protein
VRLVQGPLGRVVADHAAVLTEAIAAGGAEQARLRRDDDHAQDRRAQIEAARRG